MADQQLRLGLAGVKIPEASRRHGSRALRAEWWFAHMHHIVDAAAEWPSPQATETAHLWSAMAEHKQAA